MIICFSCSPRLKSLLDELLHGEHYKNYAEVIGSAVENLSALRQELTDRGHLVIGSDNLLAGDTAQEVEQAPRTHPSEVAGGPTSSQGAERPLKDPACIPEFFSLSGIQGKESRPSAEEIPDLTFPAGPIPLPEWIFGQYNRLLPIKAACRGLARLLCSQPAGIKVDEGPDHIAGKATGLGNYLHHADEGFGHTRDQRLATAFPTTGGKVAKSQDRFAKQFVAHLGSRGQLGGLLSDLKLINGTSASNECFQLTESGWQFALFKSPVLDEGLEVPVSKFSEEEVVFLLDHVSSSVPVEDFAFSSVLEAIHGGANTPRAIDAELRKFGTDYEGRRFTDSFLSSQRSGAISRMTDLGLVVRKRLGTHVVYETTSIGDGYLDKSHQKAGKGG